MVKLNFQKAKVNLYKTEKDENGVERTYITGESELDRVYVVIENEVEFRIIKQYLFGGFSESGEQLLIDDYSFYIKYEKETIFSKKVESFEDGFEVANEWARKHLYDSQYLSEMVRKAKEIKYLKRLEDEKVDNMSKAKSMKFPACSKYEGKNIYYTMQGDLDHCVAYYVGNLNEDEFDFKALGVKKLNYRPSSKRTASYNCIKYLLQTQYPYIYNDLLGFFTNVKIGDIHNRRFPNGKYKGKTIYNVNLIDPSYVRWYYNNMEKTIYNVRLMNTIALLLKQ